ncbi:MAG: amino acid transporter [Chloroflexota bacterium]|nr:amino acid transporter [Chloroflexota bacterium]
MTHDVPLHELPWNPLSVAEAADRFTVFPGRWWIAGGWAIDLFIGRQTREHADIGVLILRDDQRHLFNTLAGWEVHAAVMHKVLRLWSFGQPFPPHVHDIWCRPTADAPWALQVMLMDSRDDRWLFRRDSRIGGPIAALGQERDGVPFLTPEIQLLFKSKNPRPRDESDLTTALPAMSADQIRSLLDALYLHDPDNPWIPELSARL